MKSVTETIQVKTTGKGTIEITDRVRDIASSSDIQNGVATVFVAHTSASLVIYENADPSARTDLHAFFEKLVPEDTPYFVHTHEGPDDMPSHIRMVLTRTSEVIPIKKWHLCLGTWQGIFIFEHRAHPHTRTVHVNVMGL
ncbi:MAG: secondary thiamine-phosphate synthase enzyme YjbQ [Verrucomicrobiota bacterium]